MSSRQGGKLKPLKVCAPIEEEIGSTYLCLKAPKKAKAEDTEEDAAFKAQKKSEADALKAAREKGVFAFDHFESRTVG
jgi:hypothetical protein